MIINMGLEKNSTELATLGIIDRIVQELDQSATPTNTYTLIYRKQLTPLITTYCYIN